METVTNKSHDTAETWFARLLKTPNTFNLLKWKQEKYYSGCMWCWQRTKVQFVGCHSSFPWLLPQLWLWHWHPRVSQRWGRRDSLEAPHVLKIVALSRLFPEICSFFRGLLEKWLKRKKQFGLFCLSCWYKAVHLPRFIMLGSFCRAPGTASNASLLPIKSVSLPTGEKPQRLPAREGASVQELSAVPLFCQTSETSASCHQHRLFPGQKVAASGVRRALKKVYLTLGPWQQDFKGCCKTSRGFRGCKSIPALV